ARFYYVADPLRGQSFGQVVALQLAGREGKYLDLMEEMFRRQDHTWGMTLDEVVEAANAVGMNGAALRTTLEDQEAIRPIVDQIMIDRVATTSVMTKPGQSGVSVPKLFIEGRLVAPTYESYSPECLTYFIEQAYAEKQ